MKWVCKLYENDYEIIWKLYEMSMKLYGIVLSC